MELYDLKRRYNTDKFMHGYMYVYERYFKDIRLDVKNVLELGVKQGTSIQLWNTYFPNATIHGLEKVDKFYDRVKEIVRIRGLEDKIKLYHGDQGDVDFLKESFKDIEFDIIIDDCSHIQYHQQVSMRTLFPYVKEGGLYIIEDLHTKNFSKYNKMNSVQLLTYDWVRSISDTETFFDKISFTRKTNDNSVLPPISYKYMEDDPTFA